MAATEGGGVPLRVDEEEEEGEGEEAGERNSEPQVWLKWYGDNQLSQVSVCMEKWVLLNLNLNLNFEIDIEM